MSELLGRQLFVAVSMVASLGLFASCSTQDTGPQNVQKNQFPAEVSFPADARIANDATVDEDGPPTVALNPDKPVASPGKTLIELQANQLSATADFKNCVSVSLGSQTVSVGCNKDTDGLTKIVYLSAEKSPVCNILSVKMDTYFKVKNCGTGAPDSPSCASPYRALPDRSRNTAVQTDVDFFRIYNDSNIAFYDPMIIAQTPVIDLKSAMDIYAQGGTSTWYRVFFEDLSRSQLDAAVANPASDTGRNISFNDYIFDMKGDDVKFTIDGTNTGCD